MRALAREHGQRLPSCSTEHFVGKVRKLELDESLQFLIDPLLITLETVETQLTRADEELGKLCSTEPVIPLLCTAPGVGAIVAACFVAVVDEAQRFHRAHQLESYLGLVPGENSSGGRRRIGAITKKGNSYLRALLVQGSWSVLRSAPADDPLRCWGEAVARHRGKRIAVVAIARRLAGVLFGMWRSGKAYDPQLLGRRSAKGLRDHAARIQLALIRHYSYRIRALSGSSSRLSARNSITVSFTPGADCALPCATLTETQVPQSCWLIPDC